MQNEKKTENEKYENYDSDSEKMYTNLRCSQCKIIRESREKFVNHLKSQRHLRMIEIHEKSLYKNR